MGNQKRQKMTSKTIIKKEDTQEYTDLITALFWIASRKLITKTAGEYELNSGTALISWWSAAGLLGVDHTELNKYYRYFVRSKEKTTVQQFRETQKAMAEVNRLSSEISKQSIEKLAMQLKTLFDKKLPLYGTKYKDNKLVKYSAKIPRTKLSNVDIPNETLFRGGYEYIKLRVPTEQLFKMFPHEKTAFSTKAVNNITGVAIFDTNDILNRNLGGVKIKLSEEDKRILLEHIENQGGKNWYKQQLSSRVYECIALLEKKHKKDKGYKKVNHETMRRYLESFEKLVK